jgi:CRP-like cAMP-binding protein
MIFDDLTQTELELVDQAGTPRHYPQGTRIVEEQQHGEAFFMIIAGRVEVRKHIGDGQYRRLAELGPCDIFGEICFLGVPTRSASVVALTDGTALEFSRATFARLVEQHPVIGLKTYRGLARELAHRMARLDDDLRDALLWAISESRGRK